jgi:hypothetical protein
MKLKSSLFALHTNWAELHSNEKIIQIKFNRIFSSVAIEQIFNLKLKNICFASTKMYHNI